MKLGKEIKLDLLDNYKTKIGTVNNKESKSLYINLCAWGQLSKLDENLNYDYYLRNVRKKIKQKLNNSLNKDLFHNHKYIVDLDIFEETNGDGKNLALQDIRFARTINRIQQAMLQELNKLAIIHLYILGLEDELENFTITLNNPSTQAEMLKIEQTQLKGKIPQRKQREVF